MLTERRVGRRWVILALIALLLSGLFINATAQRSVAQEGGAATADEGAPRPAAPKEQNYLIWIIVTSGPIGFVIFCLSVYFIATVARMFMELRMVTAMPPELVSQCEALLEQRDFKGIFNVVKDDDSYFSRVLVTGITELPNGLSEARESMERVADMLTAEMDKKISMLAVLGTLGPMIGLLGTLMGMIHSFGAIARGGSHVDTGPVAKGISEALLLTFEGVGLSVPSIFFFAIFRNKISIISVTSLTRADEFLRHFAQAARGKSPAAAAKAKV